MKKYVFPHEVYVDQQAVEKKRRTIYRHYYNYAFSSGIIPEENYFDTFIYENFSSKDIFEQRAIFERIITKDKDSFVNYLVSDEIYFGIVSDLGPTIRTLVNLAYSSFEIRDLKRCRILIKDLKDVLNVTPINVDPILFHKIQAFGSFIEETSAKKKDEWVNYTKLLIS
jgi:hypothetical protein